MHPHAGNTEDAEAIEELEIALFPDNCFNTRTLKIEISIGTCYVFYKEDILVGYILSRWDCHANLLDITRLGVRSEYQNQGIGEALLRTLLAETNSATMLLALKTNTKAIRLYQRLGFQITGQIQQSWLLLRPRSLDAL